MTVHSSCAEAIQGLNAKMPLCLQGYYYSIHSSAVVLESGGAKQ